MVSQTMRVSHTSPGAAVAATARTVPSGGPPTLPGSTRTSPWWTAIPSDPAHSGSAGARAAASCTAAASFTASVGEWNANSASPSAHASRRPSNARTSGRTSASCRDRARARASGPSEAARSAHGAMRIATRVRFTSAGSAAEGIPRKLARIACGVWRSGVPAPEPAAAGRSGASAPSSSARSSAADPARRARSFSVARATNSTSRGQSARSGATEDTRGTRSKACAATSARRSDVANGCRPVSITKPRIPAA